MKTVVGIEKCVFDFVDKRTGRNVHSEGIRIHYHEDISADRGEGVRANNAYFSYDKLALTQYVPAIGDVVEFGFDNWHKPNMVMLVTR